jgi:hypothetical protein
MSYYTVNPRVNDFAVALGDGDVMGLVGSRTYYTEESYNPAWWQHYRAHTLGVDTVERLRRDAKYRKEMRQYLLELINGS